MSAIHIEAELTVEEMLIETLDRLRAMEAKLDRIEVELTAAGAAKVEVRHGGGGWWYVYLNGHQLADFHGFSRQSEAMQAAADLRLELQR